MREQQKTKSKVMFTHLGGRSGQGHNFKVTAKVLLITPGVRAEGVQSSLRVFSIFKKKISKMCIYGISFWSTKN